MQTNFYYKVQPGREVSYAHGQHINVELDTSADYHTYKLEWTPTEMKWYFDGVLKRTAAASEVVGSYPDTPMRVAFGLWDGGYGSEGKIHSPVSSCTSAHFFTSTSTRSILAHIVHTVFARIYGSWPQSSPNTSIKTEKRFCYFSTLCFD